MKYENLEERVSPGGLTKLGEAAVQ